MTLAPAITHLLQRPEAERRLGSFFLVKALGHGGFAPVWLAKEGVGSAELRTVAVKLFPLHGTGEAFGEAGSAGRKLFVEEARALCKVNHPNVVGFYTLCVDEPSGVLGLVMEYLAGTPLNERITAEGRLSDDETIRVGIAIASALSAVHRAKLVHRDVKPGNVVEAAGVYKLIDFGIAAADALNAPELPQREERAGAPDVQSTGIAAHGAAVDVSAEATVRVVGLQSGTLGYIDPVCIATGAPASPASDLYALGATLYECLTGEVPAAATARGTGQIQQAVLEGRTAPLPLRTLVPGVYTPLAELVDRMVAPIRHGRPPSAQWVARRLEEIRLERQAEQAFAAFEATRPDAAEAAKAVLLALTTPAGTPATRSMQELAAMGGSVAQDVVDSFVKAGLVTIGPQGLTFADDALITHWKRLRDWIDEAREDRLLAEELERDARRWQKNPDRASLWKKRDLASAEELCHRRGLHISEEALAFVRASRRAERRARWGVGTALMVVTLMPLGAGLGYWKGKDGALVTTAEVSAHDRENPRPKETRQMAGDSTMPVPVTSPAQDTPHFAGVDPRVVPNPPATSRPRAKKHNATPQPTSTSVSRPVSPATATPDVVSSPVAEVAAPAQPTAESPAVRDASPAPVSSRARPADPLAKALEFAQ